MGALPSRAPNRRQASGWRQTRSLISRRMLSLHKRQTGNSKACAGAIYYDEQATDIRRFSSQIRSPSFLSTYLIAAFVRIFVFARDIHHMVFAAIFNATCQNTPARTHSTQACWRFGSRNESRASDFMNRLSEIVPDAGSCA